MGAATMAKKPKTTGKLHEHLSKIGAEGGKARGEKLRAGLVPVSGAAVPTPTKCARCGEVQPSARAAWRHCRAAKPGPKK